jgi:hypothetical protein
MKEEEMRDYNQGVGESAQITQNVDKGFVHYLKYFKNDKEVVASMQIEQGHQGDFGWGVFFEQGRRRCVLIGTISRRPEEEAMEDGLWTACAERANFEPVVGQPKTHVETLYFPEVCTNFSMNIRTSYTTFRVRRYTSVRPHSERR